MDSELIAKALNDACQDDKLNFQIVLQESILHIYINREVDSKLNYAQLINKISEVLTTLNISWEGFWLYSRVMGEIDPDWQTYVEFQVYVSDQEPNPLIEETEDLIQEAKESLQDLKYLQDRDLLATEELDEAILNKDSRLLVMESVEEIENSLGDKTEDKIEDLFVVEELDDSVLDKDSNLSAQESVEEIGNSLGDKTEDKIEDLFVVEELDDSILDKNSFLLIQESVGNIDNHTNETDNPKIQIEENNTEDLFTSEEINGKAEQQEFDNLTIDPEPHIDESLNSSPNMPNFSEFCFIRNQGLLKSEIVAPKLNIAHLVSFFHDLSQENKYLLLPLLTQHFQPTNKALDTSQEQFSPTIQEWLQKITKLNPEQTRKAAIWLSRYCHNPEKTIAEIQIVFDHEAAKQEAARQATEQSASLDNNYENNDLSNHRKRPNTYQKSKYLPKDNSPKTPLKEPRGLIKKLTFNSVNILIPIIWTAITIIFVIVGIVSTNSNAINSKGIPVICEHIINPEATDNCQLAVDLVGQQILQEASQKALPFSTGKEYVALLNCQKNANIKAGLPLDKASSIDTSVIGSYGQEILRGIYFAEAKQKNLQQEENNIVRVACIFGNLNPEESPVMLASDIIPYNWPAVQYGGKSFLRQLQPVKYSLGIYAPFVILGFSTLFTAIALFIASVRNWGITIYSVDTLYKSALVLGIVEVIFSRLPITRLPIIGLLASIVLQALAIGITSAFIKGFKLNWNDGYSIVALGMVTVLVIRTALHGLLIVIVSAFVL